MKSRHERIKLYGILDKYDDKLIRKYLEYGPNELRKKLEVDSDHMWEVIFDYLVFEKDVVKHCVRNNVAYIHNLFVEKGPRLLRKAFSLEGDKYDDIWEYVMDYVGISRGALYEYVTENASKYRERISSGECMILRNELCIKKNKYERVWGEILDILLHAVSTQAFTHSAFEHGIELFSKLYNQGRVHKSIRSSQLKKAE